MTDKSFRRQTASANWLLYGRLLSMPPSRPHNSRMNAARARGNPAGERDSSRRILTGAKEMFRGIRWLPHQPFDSSSDEDALSAAALVASVAEESKPSNIMRDIRLEAAVTPERWHRIVSAYYMWKKKQAYHELGDNFLDTLKPEKTADRLLKRLAKLGYTVIIKGFPSPAA